MSIGVFEWKSIKLTCNDNFETNVNTNRHLNLLQQVHIFQRLFVIIWINSAPLFFGWINLMVKHYLHPLSWDQVCWWSRIEKKSQRYQFCHAYEGCLKLNLQTIIKSKYKCDSSGKPIVSPKHNASNFWKCISSGWNYLDANLISRIGNGKMSKF